MYVYVLLAHTRTVTYYMTDPPSRQGDRPTTNRNCLDYNQTLVTSRGGAQRQDGLTY
jgi:hypothetical protein